MTNQFMIIHFLIIQIKIPMVKSNKEKFQNRIFKFLKNIQIITQDPEIPVLCCKQKTHIIEGHDRSTPSLLRLG